MAANFISAMRYSISACCAVAVVENLLAIAVFVGTSQIRIKYYAFVFNLALADLLFAIVEIPIAWDFNSSVLHALLAACYTVSILMILAVAVNRYLALRLVPPARYDALVTRGRLVGVCLCIWILCGIIGVLRYVILSYEVAIIVGRLVTPLGFTLVLLITAILYCLLFLKIRRYTPPLASSPGIDPSRDQADTRIRQTRRLLVTFVLILVTAFISWMPYGILVFILYFNESLLYSGLNYQAYLWGASLVYCLSTLVNPLIYWWRLDGFREGFYAMLCRCFIKADTTETKVDHENQQTVAETGL